MALLWGETILHAFVSRRYARAEPGRAMAEAMSLSAEYNAGRCGFFLQLLLSLAPVCLLKRNVWDSSPYPAALVSGRHCAELDWEGLYVARPCMCSCHSHFLIWLWGRHTALLPGCGSGVNII